MRLTLTIAIVSLIAALTPSALADNDTIITIEGSGWGHGVGMSQYGAYGRALSVENGGGGQTAPKSLISIIRLHQSATKPR